MKNLISKLSIIAVFFIVSFTSCKKEEEGINVKEKLASSRIAACTLPTNFFPANASTTGSDLFKYRYGVALYRYFVKLTTDYNRQESQDNGNLPRRPRPSVGEAVTNTGLTELNSVITSLAPYIKKTSGTDQWASTTAFIDIVTNANLPLATQQAIVNKANAYDGNTDVGSYSIIFNTPSSGGGSFVYSGKGGGTARCIASASTTARCAQNPLRADFQKASVLYVSFSYIQPQTLRQAFKEESVRMYQSGFANSNLVNDDNYNLNQSPGKNYIIADGF